MKSIIDQGAREGEKERKKKNDPSNRCLIGNVNSRDIDFFSLEDQLITWLSM